MNKHPRQRELSALSIILLTCSLNANSMNQYCQNDIAKSIDTARYTINDQGNITDTQTQLIWQACIVGLKGKNCETGQALKLSWGDALAYIEQYNTEHKQVKSQESYWRLANVRELASLAELSCTRPAIQTSIFKNTPSAHHWSASPYQFYPHYSWYVNFEDGVYSYDDRTELKYIRLVRDVK